MAVQSRQGVEHGDAGADPRPREVEQVELRHRAAALEDSQAGQRAVGEVQLHPRRVHLELELAVGGPPNEELPVQHAAGDLLLETGLADSDASLEDVEVEAGLTVSIEAVVAHEAHAVFLRPGQPVSIRGAKE